MAYTRAAKPAGGRRMPDEEKQALFGSMIDEARQFVDGELSPERAKATDYYHGRPFGNEEPGRSQVVLTVLRDTVLGILPSFLRVFFGSERAVEFVPRRPDAVEQAEQATDFVNHVFVEENNGFIQSLSVAKDGFTRRLGVFKYWWDDSRVTRAYRMENLTLAEYQALQMDLDVTFTNVEQNPDGTYNCDLTKRESEGRVRVESVPPEEFLFSRTARNAETAQMVAHRTEKTRGELIAMGYDPAVIDEHGGEGSDLDSNVERIARMPGSQSKEETEGGKANDKIIYIEAYPYLDVDGDGVAELRKICAIGSGYHILHDEPCSERPFAVFTPDPEPHTLVGQGLNDRTMDLQKSMSSVARATLDGLAASIFPRTAYWDTQVNPIDIRNTEIGAAIRTKVRPAEAIMEYKSSFDGATALGTMEWLEGVRENRTGLNKGAMGLDADALQSSTKGAVGAAVTAAQAQAEMLARVFAEMTMKPLFRGILRLVAQHRPRTGMIKLRGKWVEVNPAAWDANMDVMVNVALGSGLVEQKIATLGAVAEQQMKLVEMFGPNNPVVSLVEIRNTLAKATELAGWADSTQFFKPITAEQLAAMEAAAAQQPPPPTPEQILAQAQIEIERMKAEKDIEIAEAKEMREHRDMLLKDDRERDRAAAEIALKTKELELKHAVDIHEAELTAEIQRQRATTQKAGE